MLGVQINGHKALACHVIVNSCHPLPNPDWIWTMPVFSATTSIGWEDPDVVPRPVVTVGAVDLDASVKGDRHIPDAAGFSEADFHCHKKGQFLL